MVRLTSLINKEKVYIFENGDRQAMTDPAKTPKHLSTFEWINEVRGQEREAARGQEKVSRLGQKKGSFQHVLCGHTEGKVTLQARESIR